MVEEEAKRRRVKEIVSASSSSSSTSSSRRWGGTKNYRWVTEVRGGIRYNTLRKMEEKKEELIETQTDSEAERKGCAGVCRHHR